MRIRPALRDDYVDLVRIHASQGIAWPEWPKDPEAWERADLARNPKYQCARWVAEEDSGVVGWAAYGQSSDEYHPRRFSVHVEVAPDRRGRGIGSALYESVMAALARFGPQVLRANAFQNLPFGYEFLTHRGFVEVFRETPVRLPLDAPDTGAGIGVEDSLRAHGIELRTLRELEGDPLRDRKLYRLYWQCNSDAPSEGGDLEIPPFEEWVVWGIQDESIDPDGYFVARREGEYVGMRELGNGGDGILLGGLMGVDRRYRRMGLATALQRRSVDYARSRGFTALKSCTAKSNGAMQSLFSAFGFQRDPEWQQCERRI
jgi:GNAT superfamily N-acetyltransferase